jgi:uncharacterized repeat protein (TIGR01451 family)
VERLPEGRRGEEEIFTMNLAMKLSREYFLRVFRSCIFLFTTFSYQCLVLLVEANSFPVSAQVQPSLCATPGKDNSPAIAGVVNTYYPGTSISGTNITLGVRRGANIDIQVGDLLVVMQMQGNSAGVYEYAVAEQVSGNSVNVRGSNNGGLQNTYINSPANNLQGQQTFQVIRVPQYLNANISSTVTSAPWNGSSGGVVVFDVAQQLNLSGNIDVKGQGFRGGAGLRLGITPTTGQTLPFPETVYEALNAPSPVTSTTNIGANGSKGEGTAGTPRFIFDSVTNSLNPPGANEGYPGGSFGRGVFGNGGGGATDGDPAGNDININPLNGSTVSDVGNDENSGGGGGGNWGSGGKGGLTWFTKKDIGGGGGNQFSATTTSVIMGGGGGAGSNNDGAGSLPGGLASSGATGGGIVLVRAGTFTGQGTIDASGNDAPIQLTANSSVQFNDGGGGGGGGGSAIVTAQNSNATSLTVNVSGGDGSDIRRGIPHGPGGGGGGGFVATVNVPLASATTVTGGIAGSFFDIIIPSLDGSLVDDSGNYGATRGNGGNIQTSGTIPGILSGAECLRQPIIYKSVKFLQDNDNSGGATVGDDLQYTLTIINPTAAAIDNVVIRDRIPSQLQVLQNTNNQIQFPNGFQAASSLPTGSFNGTGQFIPLTNPNSLPPNSQLTLIYNARILAGVSGQVENVAGIDLTPNDVNTQPEIISDASDSTNPTQAGSGINPGIPDTNRDVNQSNNSNTDPTILVLQTFTLPPLNAKLYGIKRITNVTRNGISIPGVNFTQTIDDPSDPNVIELFGRVL